MPPRPAFPDSVAIEKQFWKPLPDDVGASSKLRRRLFQGHVLSAEDGVALGGTNGLLGAATRNMEEWGFEFEHSKNEAGKKCVKLINPQHIPTDHVKKPSTGVTRNRQKNGDDDGGEKLPKGWSPIHAEIRQKLLDGDEVSIGESMAMGASSAFLRKEVSRMSEQGYKVGSVGHGVERRYRVMKHPVKRGRSANAESNGNGKAKGKALERANGKDLSNRAAESMMFGELATPPPRLGSRPRVIGMMLDEDDETVKIAIKDESGTWMTRIEGYVEADA